MLFHFTPCFTLHIFIEWIHNLKLEVSENEIEYDENARDQKTTYSMTLYVIIMCWSCLNKFR